MPSQTSQRDFGALTVELPAESDDGLSLCSPQSFTSATEPAVIRLVVERQRPYKVKEPSPEWLNLFGFTPAQVTNRAMRICQGPQTNVQALKSLIENADHNPVAIAITFYTNSGDELTLNVSARPHGTDETVCALSMEDESAPKIKEKSAKIAKMVLSAEPPFNVANVNKHFLKYFLVLEADVLEQGASAIFCSRTEGTRWRNLINSALAGGHGDCIMSTNRGDDTAQMTRVAITPIFDKFGHTVVQLEVKFSDPPIVEYQYHHDFSSSGSKTSTESFCSDTETKTEAQRIASAFSRTSSSGPDKGLMSHLKAMKAARKQKLEEESAVSLADSL